MRLRWNTHFQEKKIFNFKTYRELITVCQKSFIFFSLLNTLLLTLVLWSKDFRFSEYAQCVARCCLNSMSFTKTPSRMLMNGERGAWSSQEATSTARWQWEKDGHTTRRMSHWPTSVGSSWSSAKMAWRWPWIALLGCSSHRAAAEPPRVRCPARAAAGYC